MRKGIVIMLGLLVVMAVRPCLAQGQPGAAATVQPTATAETNPEANQVIFYQGRDYKGDSMTLQAGEEIPNLDKTRFGSWSERIKSLKVGADAIVVMFSWFNYRGDCWVFRGANVGGVTGRYVDLTKFGHGNPASNSRSMKTFLKTYPERLCQSAH